MSSRTQTQLGTPTPYVRAAVEILEPRKLLTAELLKDVNDVGGDGLGGGYEMVEYHDRLYFFANSPETGTELWSTDGGRLGAVGMVKHLVPGPGGVIPTQVEVVNDLIFFVDESTRTLWRSDGTSDGTFALAPARGGSADSPALAPAAGGTRVVFIKPGSTELWSTDGTVAGTRRVFDLAVQPQILPLLGGLTAMGDMVYFWVKAPTGQSYQLYRTDGVAGAKRVAERSFMSFRDEPRKLTPAGSRLFFVADGFDPFVYDAVTDRTLTIAPPELHFAHNLVAVGNTIFFTGTTTEHGDELWRSDGTAAGTRLAADLIPGFGGGSNPGPSAVLNGQLYFAAADATGAQWLWRIAPADAAPMRVTEIAAPAGRSMVRGINTIGDRLYLAIENDAVGDSMWVSDGTAAGTTKFAQMPPDALPPATFPPVAVPPVVEAGGRLFFIGQDGVRGRELWTTDGTPGGTGLLYDAGGGTASAAPVALFDAKGLSYFWAAHGSLGGGIWRTDGTAAGTVFLMQTSDADVKYLGQAGDNVLFRARDPLHGSELWRTDGTRAGTRLVKDVVPGPSGSGIQFGGIFDGVLYFSKSGPGPWQVWRSDGTEAGTANVMDISAHFFELTSDGERLLLSFGGKLYQSDGTAAGTTPLAGAGPGPGFLNPEQFTVTEKGTFFAGKNSSNTLIWLTDGTPAGTRPIGSGYDAQRILQYVNGILYFLASDDMHGPELWRTDGTDAGTFMLADAYAGSGGQYPSQTPLLRPWIAYNNLLLVELINSRYERQLWRTDGTVAGTYALPLPGTTSITGFIPPMAVVGGLAYLADGGRIWSTDGTVDGTEIVSWEPFDEELTNPGEFMSVNGDLVFAATHPVIGRELYKLDVPHVLTVTGTAGDDHWVLRDHTNGFLGLWSNNKPVTEPPDFRWDPIDIAALRFEGLAGNDTLVIGGDTYFPVHFNGGEGADRLAASGVTHPVRGNFDVAEVSQGGDLLLAGDVALERLTISGGGRITLIDGDTPITLRTKTLGIATAAGSAIDLSDNTLIIEGADAATVEALLASARNAPAGRWKGPGITSLTAANGSPLTGLAASQVGDDVIVKYTYNGDANLDGRVNADDYFRIDQGFLAQPQDPLFAQGDFNYDNRINADDYFLIDQAFLGQGAPLGGSGSSPLTSATAVATSVAVPHERVAETTNPRRRRTIRAPWSDPVAPRRSRG